MLHLLSLRWLHFFRIRLQSKGEITIKEGKNTIGGDKKPLNSNYSYMLRETFASNVIRRAILLRRNGRLSRELRSG